MSQRVVVQIIDDLDGSPVDDGTGSTIAFSLEGTDYEIDLSNANTQKLRDALAVYIKAARKAGNTRAARRSSTPKSGDTDVSLIREWAKSQGIPVSERGRIAAHITEAYASAH